MTNHANVTAIDIDALCTGPARYRVQAHAAVLRGPTRTAGV